MCIKILNLVSDQMGNMGPSNHQHPWQEKKRKLWSVKPCSSSNVHLRLASKVGQSPNPTVKPFFQLLGMNYKHFMILCYWIFFFKITMWILKLYRNMFAKLKKKENPINKLASECYLFILLYLYFYRMFFNILCLTWSYSFTEVLCKYRISGQKVRLLQIINGSMPLNMSFVFACSLCAELQTRKLRWWLLWRWTENLFIFCQQDKNCI